MMIWDVTSLVQGSPMRQLVEAKTPEGAEAKVRKAAMVQLIDDADVIVGMVEPYKSPEEQKAEVDAELDKQEMIARVRKGVQLVNRLANDLLNASVAGVDVGWMYDAVEEAAELMKNAADATERGEEPE